MTKELDKLTQLRQPHHFIGAAGILAMGILLYSSMIAQFGNVAPIMAPLVLAAQAAGDQPVYQDALTSPWIDISWGATNVLSSTEQVLSGTSAIKSTLAAWGGLWLRSGNWGAPVAVDTTQYSGVQFSVHGGATGVRLNVRLANDQQQTFPSVTYNVPAGGFTTYTAPVSTLNPGNQAVHSLVMQEYQGTPKTFYVDDVKFVAAVGGGGDTTPPTVSLTVPSGGATVSGASVTVSATAADNVGLAGVQFKLDGVNLGTEDATSPYSLTWNSTGATNGTHTLSAVARDAAGNTATASSVTVTVSNSVNPPVPDTIPPTVSLTVPALGATVSGSSVTVSAIAADNVGVAGVQFKLDGANLGAEDAASPYSIAWDTTGTSNGSHTLTAVARDAAGNSTTSSSVVVIVSNTTGGGTTNGFSVIGYYPTWDVGLGYTPQDVDFSIVTHAIHFSVSPTQTPPYFNPGASFEGSPYINPKTGQTVPSVQRGLIDEAHAHGQKALLGIADVAFYGGQKALSWILSDTARTSTFIGAIMSYVQQKGYDGVDINWEYPGVADRVNFTEFLRQLRLALDGLTPHGTLTITADVAALDPVNRGVDVNAVNSYVDFMIVESISRVVGAGNVNSGIPNAIYHPSCTPFDAYTYNDSFSPRLNGYVTVNGWAQAGVQKPKLAMYMPTYFEWFSGIDGPCQPAGAVQNHSYIPMTLGKVLQRYGSSANLVIDDTAKARYFKFNDPTYGKSLVTYWDETTATDYINYLKSQGFTSVILYELGTAYVNKTDMPVFAKPRDYLLQAIGAAIRSGGPPVPDTIPPTVSLTVPSSGATVSGSSVIVSATAADNIGVVGVQFKLDGANLGTEDITSPYATTWNSPTATNGSHTLTAVARDAAGNSATATSVAVTVSNAAPDTTPPTVTFTAPANGASVSGSAVTISANASDNVGVIGVQFKVDGSNVGAEDTVAPYALSWNSTTVSSGNHLVAAVARDAAGNTTFASPLTITVSNTIFTPDTTPPTTTLTAPVDGSTVAGTVALAATATDNVGVTRVDFLVNGTVVGSSAASPYGFNWVTGSLTGSQVITAKAYDAAGNVGTAASVTVTVGVAVDLIPPPPVTGLTAQVASSTRVALSWQASVAPDLAGYRVYKAPVVVGAVAVGILLGSPAAASYTDTDASANSNYIYSVTAVDTSGNESTATTVSVRTPSAAGGGGGGGGGGSGGGSKNPTPKDVPAVAPDTANLPGPAVTPSAPLVPAANPISYMEEGRKLATGSAEAVREAVDAKRDLKLEQAAAKSIPALVTAAKVSVQDTHKLVSFVAYGTASTASLAPRDRASLVESFQAVYRKPPQTEAEWQALVSIANGRPPALKNAASERQAAVIFRRIYRRPADAKRPADQAALNLLAYSVRPRVRVLKAEQAALKTFHNVWGRAPRRSADWNIIRAIAYSGAVR